MNDDELSQLLRLHASRHPAGERLHAAVRTQIALHSAARADAPAATRRERWLAAWAGGWRLLATGGAAGLALGVLITLGAVQQQAARHASDLADELVAGHVRALQVGPVFEVASSNRHQVKPWFQGRLDYAPPVLDAVPGVPLLGGRVQVIQGHPTAVLAYELRLHKIDLFVWPVERSVPPAQLQRRGFNLQGWSDGAMQYWAVSDVDGAELKQFSNAWRAAAAKAAAANN